MIGHDFFEQDPVTCARGLIGCEIVWNGCGGIIVETEAYAAHGDEACHTFTRPSAREFVANLPPGTAYVYLNYGVHWLMNFLVKGGAEDGFVLLRALEPTRGIPLMKERRGTDALDQLCSGPGKLTRALGIDGSQHGRDFLSSNLAMIHPPRSYPEILAGSRIGISRGKDLAWRFVAAGNPHLSAKSSS